MLPILFMFHQCVDSFAPKRRWWRPCLLSFGPNNMPHILQTNWKKKPFNSHFTNFLPECSLDNESALVQLMACRLLGAKPLAEPMLIYRYLLKPMMSRFTDVSPGHNKFTSWTLYKYVLVIWFQGKYEILLKIVTLDHCVQHIGVRGLCTRTVWRQFTRTYWQSFMA